MSVYLQSLDEPVESAARHPAGLHPSQSPSDPSPSLSGSRLRSSDDLRQFRELSPAAVAAFALGVFSPAAVLSWLFVAIPVAGVVTATWAVRYVGARRSDLSGLPLAWAGLSLSAAFLIIAPAVHAFAYAAELPPGFERLNFAELQPDERFPGLLLPPAAKELEGKKIFIKGYMYPGSQQSGIRKFLLVGDKGECCFGGNPKLTDRIQIVLNQPPGVNFKDTMRAVAGVFHVRPEQAADAKGAVYYHLDAELVR